MDDEDEFDEWQQAEVILEQPQPHPDQQQPHPEQQQPLPQPIVPGFASATTTTPSSMVLPQVIPQGHGSISQNSRPSELQASRPMEQALYTWEMHSEVVIGKTEPMGPSTSRSLDDGNILTFDPFIVDTQPQPIQKIQPSIDPQIITNMQPINNTYFANQQFNNSQQEPPQSASQSKQQSQPQSYKNDGSASVQMQMGKLEDGEDDLWGDWTSLPIIGVTPATPAPISTLSAGLLQMPVQQSMHKSQTNVGQYQSEIIDTNLIYQHKHEEKTLANNQQRISEQSEQIKVQVHEWMHEHIEGHNHEHKPEENQTHPQQQAQQQMQQKQQVTEEEGKDQVMEKQAKQEEEEKEKEKQKEEEEDDEDQFGDYQQTNHQQQPELSAQQIAINEARQKRVDELLSRLPDYSFVRARCFDC